MTHRRSDARSEYHAWEDSAHRRFVYGIGLLALAVVIYALVHMLAEPEKPALPPRTRDWPHDLSQPRAVPQGENDDR